MRRIALCLALVGCDDRAPQPDPTELAHVPDVYPGPCLQEEYRGGAQQPSSAVRTGYDGQGRVTLRELVGDDGHAFSREERSYDQHDREVETDELWSIRHYDGTGYDRWTRHHRVYDAADRVTRHIEDYGRDGSADVVRTWRYNAAGEVTEEKIDQASSRVPDYVRRHTYDADGNKTRYSNEERWADHVVHTTIDWHYDAGALIAIEGRIDGDLAYQHIYERDTRGRVVYEWEDIDGDGQPEWARTHHYSEGGREHTEEHDEDGDGRVDVIWVRMTAEDGFLAETRYDADADGAFEKVTRYSRGDGWLMQTRDEGDDGTIDYVYHRAWTTDASGRKRVASETRDLGGDGILDEVTTWTYGEHGVQGEETVGPDGAVIRFTRYEYDRLGNLLSIESPGFSRRYHYICPWSPFVR